MNWILVEASLPDQTRETIKLPTHPFPRTGEFITFENRRGPDGQKELFIVQALLWQTSGDQAERFALLMQLGRAPLSPDLRLESPAQPD